MAAKESAWINFLNSILGKSKMKKKPEMKLKTMKEYMKPKKDSKKSAAKPKK